MEQHESDFSLAEVQTDSRKLADYVELVFTQYLDNGSQSLTEGQLAIVLAFISQGIITSGGFRYFYEKYDDPKIVAWAYGHLGLDEAAAAVDESRRALPSGLLEGDYAARIAWMNENRPELKEKWDEPEHIIMDLSKNSPERPGDVLETRARQYIMDHLMEFKFEI